MTPSQWGPPTWTMFHTLIEKLKDESFETIGPQLFGYIYRICNFLPCPDCSQHAKKALSSVKTETLKNKLEFKNLFYAFHNFVNKRKNKPLYDYGLIDKYAKLNLVNTVNHFISVYNTRGNMKLLSESFQRNMIIKDFKNWLNQNWSHFNP